MTRLRAPLSLGATTALLVLLLAGCREEPVRTYRTGKEPLPPAMPAPSQSAAGQPAAGELPAGHPPIGAGAMNMPGAAMPSPAATANTITWAAPDHWEAKPPGAMRRGSFTARNATGEADCAIFVFPAASNPLLANINRWRGQIGLPEITEAQLPTESARLESNGLSFTIIDNTGQTANGATRVLGAILYLGEEAWFFKMSGPDAAVAAEKPAFLDFLRTVRPATP